MEKMKHTPQFREQNLKKSRKHAKYIVKKKEVLLNEKTPFAVSEAFRNLKAALSVSVPKDKEGGVAMMITSSFPQDGKTAITANLGLMFAQSEAKIVVVDADMRKGRLGKYFTKENKPGLSDYLSGGATLEEILKPSGVNDNLYVITSGTNSPKPYELLESQRMKELGEKLKEKFDYVLYDTPPVLLLSDALALAPATDGTVLVCRYLASHVSDIVKSVNVLEFAKVNILGVVVNDYKTLNKKNGKRYSRYEDAEYPYAYTDAKLYENAATTNLANTEKTK